MNFRSQLLQDCKLLFQLACRRCVRRSRFELAEFDRDASSVSWARCSKVSLGQYSPGWPGSCPATKFGSRCSDSHWATSRSKPSSKSPRSSTKSLVPSEPGAAASHASKRLFREAVSANRSVVVAFQSWCSWVSSEGCGSIKSIVFFPQFGKSPSRL